MNIILDPNIFELADSQTGNEITLKHFNYLTDLLGLLKSYRCSVIVSEEEHSFLCQFSNHPWSQFNGNPTQYNSLVMVYGEFQSLFKDCLRKCPNECELISLSISPKISYCSKNDSKLFKNFLMHLYCIRNSKEYVIFMGTANHAIDMPLKLLSGDLSWSFFLILDINNEDIKFFSNEYRKFLFTQDLVHPSLNNPLPNKTLCDQYLDLQNSLISSGKDPKAVYKKVAKEVALRNGYEFDKKLSRINSNFKIKREIYRHSQEDIFLSVDFEHGAFEVCNCRGEHVGEFSYIGEKLASRDENGNHDIRVQ